MDWAYFKVIRALQPVLTRFNPEILYLDEDIPRELNLTGRNFIEESEIYLLSRDVEKRGELIMPAEYQHSASGDIAHLVFGSAVLLPGIYEVWIKNPGGLETSLGPLRVTYRRTTEFNVSAGYAPVLPLYGHAFTIFERKFFPLGAYVRMSFIPLR
jgi:hypothetical protein